MGDAPRDHQDHHPEPAPSAELPDGPPADPTQIVIEPSGPLPEVPSSPLLSYALLLSFLAPLIGWQTGHLVWGIVAAPVLFVVLSAVGSRLLFAKVNRACARLAQEGRPLDIVPFLHKCHLTYPHLQPIRSMLDQALAAVSLAQSMQRAEGRGDRDGTEEDADAWPQEAPDGDAEILVSLAGEPELQPPVEKVVSGLAVAAWILAAFALIPLLGALPAVALLVLGILLVARPQRSLDRKVGVAALVIAGISLVVTAVVVLAMVSNQDAYQATRPLAKTGGVPWTVKVAMFAVLVISIILHECAHGLAAWWSGDTTARDQGRLTLNPIPHIDLFGSIVLPAIMVLMPGGFVIGWAKPVPVNPLRFRRERRSNLAVSLAGVSVNLMLAFFCAGALTALAFGLRAAYPDLAVTGFADPLRATHFSGVENAATWELITGALKAGVFINMVLANFNAIPIPPLDGFHVLQTMLPQRLAEKLEALSSYGFLILLALLFLRVINYLLIPGLLLALLLMMFAGAAGGMT